VAFHPDGRLLATASTDGTARLWDTTSGQEIARVVHDRGVSDVTFSRDGQYLATASDDGSARVVSAVDGRDIGHFKQSAAVLLARFSPDGRQLATGDRDGTIRLWELASGREVQRLRFGGRLQALAFSPDGGQVAAAGTATDAKVRVWDATEGREIRQLDHDGRELPALAFSPDGGQLALADPFGMVSVRDAVSDAEVVRLPHSQRVLSVTYSADGRLLATTSLGTARVWDTISGQTVATVGHPAGAILAAAFSPDGRRLATVGEDATARVWILDRQVAFTEACQHLTRNLTEAEWLQYLPDEPFHQTCPDLP
jgi:WD40 repeat protein